MSAIFRNTRILVIDDNPAIHDDMRKILCPPVSAEAASLSALEAELLDNAPVSRAAGSEPKHFSIDSAYQGREGLALVEKAVAAGEPHALAFVDVRMPPGWDGIETTLELWKVAPDLQIVICTAYTDYSWDEMLAKIGGSDRLLILKKPFDTIEVLQLANALTEKWHQQQQIRASARELEQRVRERTADLEASIVEKEKVDAQLFRTQRMESIGTLAGGIAHDLNNVLTPILISLSMLRLKTADEATLKLLDMLESSARHGEQLIRQVLVFGRGIDGKRIEIRPADIVREIGQMIRDTFPKDIRFEQRLPRDLWTVTGDPTHLHQVMLNLCVNARDAMPGGGRLTIELENVRLDETCVRMNRDAKTGPHLVFTVADTGTGIPREIQERVFEPFFTTKAVGKGSGLGLSTTLAIVKSHGGFIALDSAPGKGTVFKIFLPANTAPAPAKSAETGQPALLRGHNELILVVDDEAPIRMVVEGMLTHFGYRVMLAENGAEAVEHYSMRRAEIDAVIVDMMMPVMDGPATVAALRAINPEVRIISSSGVGPAAEPANLAPPGLQYFVPKPYTADIMLQTLRNVLGKTGRPPLA